MGQRQRKPISFSAWEMSFLWFSQEGKEIVRLILLKNYLVEGCFVRLKSEVLSLLGWTPDLLNSFLISLVGDVSEISLEGLLYLRYNKPYKAFSKEEVEFFNKEWFNANKKIDKIQGKKK